MNGTEKQIALASSIKAETVARWNVATEKTAARSNPAFSSLAPVMHRIADLAATNADAGDWINTSGMNVSQLIWGIGFAAIADRAAAVGATPDQYQRACGIMDA